jgi:diguanylate cyclase (GGDEF)-like protein
MGSSPTNLPQVVARAVESVRVAPAVRALARRFGPISLEVHLAAGGSLPPGLAQLVKLAVLEPESFPIECDTSLGEAWVLAKRGAFEERIDEVALRGRLEDILVPVLAVLVPPEQLVRQALVLMHEIEDLTRYDHATGIFNRKELEVRFSQERARAQRAGTSLAFLLVGLDDLPPGHRGGEPGDSLLRSAGSLLREELRALDVAARFDESELAVVLPGAGALEAAHVARRLGVSAMSRGLSLSIGVAAFPEDCDHPDDLVRLAGLHLSAARDSGPGRACLSEDGDPIIFAQEGSPLPP